MVKRYLEYVYDEASQRHEAGMSAEDATKDIDLGEFADWGDSERLVVNVQSVYSELDPSYEVPAIDQLLVGMAHFA